MNTQGKDTYRQRIADIYDELYAEYDEAAIETLAELARGGPALELGIGTGRVALPLKAKGVVVHGIDASEAMLARLRAKPGGENIPTSLGDFAEVAVEGKFSLIYVVFNTFFALLTQEEQVTCFVNVASRLTPEGVFLLEAFVPDLTRFSDGQAVRLVGARQDEVQLDVSQLDRQQQQVSTQHVILRQESTRLYPVKLRFVWPAELDLMARLAGMRLRERWSNWKKEPFSGESSKHISVYEQGG